MVVNFTPPALAAQVFAEGDGLFRVKGLSPLRFGSLLTTTGGQRESSRVILPSMASWMHWSKSGCSSSCTSGFIQ